MKLNFSKHAKIQIEQRGLTIPGVIKDWGDGMFIKCFMNKKTEHFVTHIPEQNVFFLLVGAPRGNKLDVITCMPLTHRDRAVSEDFKNEAYNKRNGLECEVSQSFEGLPKSFVRALQNLH